MIHIGGSDEGSGVALGNNNEEMYGSSAGLVRYNMEKFYRVKQLNGWLQKQSGLVVEMVQTRIC